MSETPSPKLGTDKELRRFDDLRDMIGTIDVPTPIVSLNRLVPSGAKYSAYVKLEWANPFGSVKDRAALSMLREMQRRGELEGRTIVEPTSGNTGIALAAIASLMDVPMIAVVPRSMPSEKEVLLRAFGAEVIRTPADAPADVHPMDIAQTMAESMVREAPDRYVMPNQYDNTDNVRAHIRTTGPEIWEQTEGRVRYVFAGFGTTGTVTGVGLFLKQLDSSIRVIAIEPVPGHTISGLKNLEETSVPGILDRSVIDTVVYVDDAETREMTLRLHREEALLIGSSGAATVAGALRYLRDTDAVGPAVIIAPDSSQKAIGYLADALGLG